MPRFHGLAWARTALHTVRGMENYCMGLWPTEPSNILQLDRETLAGPGLLPTAAVLSLPAAINWCQYAATNTLPGPL